MPEKGPGSVDAEREERTTSADWIAVGKVGRAHGLNGELRFFPYNDGSSVFEVIDQVQLDLKGNIMKTRVTQLRGGARFLIMRLDGVRGRQDAEKWTHAELSVPAELFEELDDGEFYGFELEGLDVIHPKSGKKVGRVDELVDFGAGPILRVRYRGVELFVPFAEPYVGGVDLDAGLIEVDADEILELHR